MCLRLAWNWLCSRGCPGTGYVAEAGLELKILPLQPRHLQFTIINEIRLILVHLVYLAVSGSCKWLYIYNL